MADVINFKGRRTGQESDLVPCRATFVWETRLGQDGVYTEEIPHGDPDLVIDQIRDWGGIYLDSEDDRTFYFPWPPSYIEIEYLDDNAP